MGPVVIKSLSRLSRDSLVGLCLRWSQSENLTPYLSSNRNLVESEEEDYLHEPAEDTRALKKLYADLKLLQDEKTSLSKREIIDRIVDGDWRRGLSLQQLADVDLAALEQNDTALRWSAMKFVPFKSHEESEASHPAKKRKISHPAVQQPHYPSISPANFVANLKSHVSPLVKAHYTLHRLTGASNLVVVRLCVIPNASFTPLSSNLPRNVRQTTDPGRVMYIALPDSCPYVYVSLTGATGTGTAPNSKDNNTTSKAKIDIVATKRIILEAIPKALSKPQERWSLENTKLTCRSLKAVGLLRGNNRPGTAGGSYSKFSEEYEWTPNIPARGSDIVKTNSGLKRARTEAEHAPLSISLPSITMPSTEEEPTATHSNHIQTRFGSMTTLSHAKLDRFHLTLTNVLSEPATPTSNSLPPTKSRPKRKRRSLEDIEAGRDHPIDSPEMVSRTNQPAQITLTFSGLDVFRGLKELALVDGGKHVDLNRLPSWMTGEKGVSGLII